MTITSRTNARGPGNDTAQSGAVEVTNGGVTYRGNYRVPASGRGRQRFAVTEDKYVSVSYLGQSKGTSIGLRGLEVTVSTLLQELVVSAPKVS